MKRLVYLVLLLILLVPRPAAAGEEDVLKFAADATGASPTDITVKLAPGPSSAVFVKGELRGHVGSTWEIARTAGYSGRPIDILVFVGTDRVVQAARLIKQEEPVLTLGIKPEQLSEYIAGFAGYDLKAKLAPGMKRAGLPDAIAGATISSGVIRSGLIRTARVLAEAEGSGTGNTPQVDLAGTERLSWTALLESKSLTRLTVSNAEADKAIGVAGNGDPGAAFADLYVGVIDPPVIGASLFGEGDYSEISGRLADGGHAIVIAANGLHSFKGTAWRKSGRFERVELEQAGKTIALESGWHKAAPPVVAKDAPELREAAVFVIPAAAGFDATAPFRLSLLAERQDDAGATHAGRFDLAYILPDRFVQQPPALVPEEAPLWEQNWRARAPAIATVVAMLLSLYLILIFQNQIAARPPLYRRIRVIYLLLTVLVLGVLFKAQLSVVHVLTFMQALRTEFSWQTFLLDPLMFVIWGWVAVALLFWGRVYCGWLCPFGALQELLNRLAQRLKIRQITVPFMLHERLWQIKYIAFLGLFAASLASMTLAFKGAEVEPFKTVVTFRFLREWPFVVYALVLLGAGLFVERFYCRYMCPLGAALAIPARLRMFEWLKRRPQCGRECRICSTKCPVQAIHPEGHINPNECIYCLNCQTLYHDEHICPPLKARAARRGNFAPQPGPGGATP